ncbi:MAG: hypothetical protein Q7S95_02675 [bacterium]|nr:hypothetical protein [bacterium]
MSAIYDFLEIGKIYREKFGGNPFGIEPLKPLVRCTAHPDCKYMYDPNSKRGNGECKGYCSSD